MAVTTTQDLAHKALAAAIAGCPLAKVISSPSEALPVRPVLLLLSRAHFYFAREPYASLRDRSESFFFYIYIYIFRNVSTRH